MKREMVNQRKYYIIVIVLLTLIIMYLHLSVTPEDHSLHNILTELHYIPLLLGAIVFGLKGAVLTFIFITVLYLPYFFSTLTDPFFSVMNRLVHILLSGLFAFIAGFLVDRERRHREQSEKDRYLAGLGQVATTIVHDLKNPLITVLGFARRIREGKGDINTASQAVINSAQDMHRTVHDVLDFAKPIRLVFKEDEVRNIINRTCDCCRTKAEEKGVKLSINLPADSVNIAIDRHHIERAIINLISNAIDASSKGQTVTIRAESEKDSLVIRITDYGSGMDKETLENIFVPFYTKKSVGTGLGMSIVKKIIEGHQGKIRIDSQKGLGTEVIIKLPYKLEG